MNWIKAKDCPSEVPVLIYRRTLRGTRPKLLLGKKILEENFVWVTLSDAFLGNYDDDHWCCPVTNIPLVD